MAQYTTYMNYVIFFRDQTEYDFALSVTGGSNLIQTNPRDAASRFGISFPYPSGSLDTISKGIYFIFPFNPGLEFNHPGATGIFVDDTVDSQLIPGQAGNPASIWPAGPDALMVWSGTIIKYNDKAAGVPPQLPDPTINIPQRRWATGAELAFFGEGGSGASSELLSIDASRIIGGMGLAYRGQNSINSWTKSVDEYRTGLTPVESRERFYVRFRRLPSSNFGFWRCHGFASASAGAALKWMSSGAVNAFDIDVASVETNKGVVFTPILNRWYRIDLFLRYGPGSCPGTPSTGRLIVYLDGTEIFNYIDSTCNGLGGGNTRHTTSELGKWTAAVDNTVEVDFDSWICSDIPSNFSVQNNLWSDNARPIDLLMGSHVKRQDHVSATLTGWTGTRGVVDQGISPETNLNSTLVSTTSGADIDAITNAPAKTVLEQAPNAIILGAESAVTGERSLNAGATDGSLGYRLVGGSPVLSVIDQTAAQAYHSVAYLPSGVTKPAEISPFHVVKRKSADANSDTTQMVQSIVEYIGSWGKEDDPNWSGGELNRGLHHNWKYANTIWGYYVPTPDAPVYIVGGTYTGNSGYQETTLPAMCHFLLIRNITSAITPICFLGSSLGFHFGITDRIIPNVRIFADSNGVCKFSVNGSDLSVNQTGNTYQYIAFCDPGMRFNYCGAVSNPTTDVTKINSLLDSAFTPFAAFAQSDLLSALSSLTGLWFKGPGHTGSNGSTLAGGAITNFGTFAAGQYTNGDSIHTSGRSQNNFSLWRLTEPGAAGVMVQILSYVGDGNPSQVITLTPTSSRVPLLALVISNTASQSFFRDPSHAGVNSAVTETGVNSTTGITAVGIDSITVDSSLNSLGLTYNIFVIPGGTAVGNGTFFNPNVRPPVGSRGTPVAPPIGDIDIIGTGGLVLSGSPALLLIKDMSGIYTIVPDKTDDTIYDRQSGQTSLNVEIPDPTVKTGHIP